MIKQYIFVITILSISTTIWASFQQHSIITHGLKYYKDIVISTKVLNFQEKLSNAYNASIIEYRDGYLLLFRHDKHKEICKRCMPKKPQVKLVRLNKNFEQITPIQTLTPDLTFLEDARLHMLQGKFFITYSDDPLATFTHFPSCGPEAKMMYATQPSAPLASINQKRFHAPGFQKHKDGFLKKPEPSLPHLHPVQRRLFIAQLDITTAHISNIKQIPAGSLALGPVEKNWMPFEYPAHQGELHYIFKTVPHEIIKVTDLNRSKAENITTKKNNVASLWRKKEWGPIHGGTPPRYIDGVYLTFFHSWRWHTEYDCWYYVMGAYTFEAQPPFCILAITPLPIFFESIYTTQHRAERLHCLYPAGFAVEKVKNKTLLHVSCGENDTSIRIVTLDKDALLKAMVPVTSLN